jgi:1,4-alpha-glucan branching enzyme
MQIIPTRAIHYHWESLLYKKDHKRDHTYNSTFGYKVESRDEQGKAKEITFQVYANNPSSTIILAGQFNNWGQNDAKKYTLTHNEEGYATITIHSNQTTLTHKDDYLFLVDGSFMRDPASTYLNEKGNSVFWDFEDPTSYVMRHNQPDTLHRASKVLQTDALGLVAKWYEFDQTKKNLAESDQDLFTYITTCGVIDKIKELGFTVVQFLPLSQSIDGDNWKYRYLVAYPFAIHKNFGDPNSFAKLIDKFHEAGIAVVCDLIISHCPYKEFTLCGMQGSDVGLHTWTSKHNNLTYLDEETPWGTKRFRYGDEHVRQFLTDSALIFATKYKVDGFRIDNVDGILRYGESGDGPDRPFGREFMRQIIWNIYQKNPLALIHLESHFFYGDNAKLLVAPQSSHIAALGATAYNSSRLTYYFHKEFMPKAVEDISVWTFAHIKEEKEWGRSNSTIADFHNHDAAAGLMHGRATGSYAYDALILKNPDLDWHARGKLKVMEAIISYGCEGRTLDLLQSHLLQTGTFEHDSSIHWGLLHNNHNAKSVEYKKAVNKLLDEPAFWPENTLYRNFINIDEQNKVLVIKRIDKTQKTKKEFIIVINLSSKDFYNYSVGVEQQRTYEIIQNSDEEQFGGSNTCLYKHLSAHDTDQFQHFRFALTIPQLAGYQVLVFK